MSRMLMNCKGKGLLPLLVMLIPLLVSCSRGEKQTVNISTMQAAMGQQVQASPVPASGSFVLGPGDKLEVRILGEEDMNATVIIRPDGFVALPLIRETVLATGMTLDDLHTHMLAEMEKLLRHPVVFVNLLEVGSMHVFVVGEVIHPKLSRPQPMTLSAVISSCGGFTQDAKTDQILVIRRHADADAEVMEVNYKAFMAGESLAPDLALQRYDVVVVPKTRISNLKYFADNVLLGSSIAFKAGYDALLLYNILRHNLDVYYVR